MRILRTVRICLVRVRVVIRCVVVFVCKMACISPVTCYYSAKVNKETGKRSLVYSSRGSHDGRAFQRPCGVCVNCRIQTTADMTVRLVHEAAEHERTAFITLTYDEKFLPVDGSLNMRHFQLFAKRLREVTGPYKRYMCGEYGEKNDRPHYHAILFGVDFDDRVYFKTNKQGDKLYTSSRLEGLWGLGHCLVGDVTMQSARYVAGYIQKKITGKLAADHYMGRCPEFAFGSNGLGLSALQKYGTQWFNNGYIVVDGNKFRIPRYYEEKYKSIDGLHLDVVKDARALKPAGNPHELDGSFNRYKAVADSVTARLNKRSFSDET